MTAFLVNTVADLQGHPDADLRAEIFGLSIALNVVGLVLTLVFWYVFTLNFDNVGAVSEMLQEADPVFSQMKQRQAAKRHARWYYRLIFRKKGMNWVTVNFLPATLVFLCGAR